MVTGTNRGLAGSTPRPLSTVRCAGIGMTGSSHAPQLPTAGYRAARCPSVMMVTLAGSSGALSGLLGIIIIDGHGALHEPIDRIAPEAPIGSYPECRYFAFACEAIDGLSGDPEQLGHFPDCQNLIYVRQEITDRFIDLRSGLSAAERQQGV
jgi:hypothetical protein